MKDNKTSVTLPGGIAGLVKSVQSTEEVEKNVLEKGAEHKENIPGKEYWSVFLEKGKFYKKKKGKLATIYIDEDLKNILDRLKYSFEENKLSVTAIVSAVVDEFIQTNKQEIEKAILSKKII